jgi:HEAT repeat protein
MLAFGSDAAPYVRSLLYSSDPDVRFYSLLMAGDLPNKSLLEPLEQRLFDADAHTRRIAVDVLARFRHLEGYADALTSLRTVATAPGRPVDTRVTAIEAIAGLRDRGSCLVLIHLLNASVGQVSAAAHKALVTITLQDMGFSVRKWTTWLQRNKNRDRIEWLIDGLTHADQAIRTAAGTELQRTSQQYFGYHPTASKRERKRSQKSYREWWEQERKKKQKT